MMYYLKLGFVLLVIAAIASGILAYVNSITEPIIEENKRQEQIKARKEVLGAAKTFDEKIEGDFTYHIGKDDSGNIVGYTFLASKYGYSSDVKTMVGVNSEFIVQKIKVIEQAETPGLGANCVNQEFQNQFSKKGFSELMVDKDAGPIASITGATITSRTIANSIQEGLTKLQSSVDKK